jgi:hypothetical protein
MFVTFADLEPPNSVDESEARWLAAELLRVTPTEDAVLAALKIQRAHEEVGNVVLTVSEMHAVLGVLAEAFGPLSGNRTTDRLRWVEQQLRRRLGDLDAH